MFQMSFIFITLIPVPSPFSGLCFDTKPLWYIYLERRKSIGQQVGRESLVSSDLALSTYGLPAFGSNTMAFLADAAGLDDPKVSEQRSRENLKRTES